MMMNRSRSSSSKRKRASTTPQSKRSRLSAAAARHVTSVFGRLVSEAGVGLSLGNEPNTINVEPAVFKRKLSSSLRLHNTTHQSLDDFNTSLSEYFEDLKRLHYGLSPVTVAEGSDVTTRLGGLDSLIRLLLGVELAQSHMIQLLMEKLLDCSSDFTITSSQFNPRDYQQLPNLILSQLIMMDFVLDGEKLCNGLLDAVDVVPVALKRDIIHALPLILTDNEHTNAATKLKDLLDDRELVAVVLSALTDLNTGTELGAEILESAMARVCSANIEDLPTVITFINNHVNPRTGHTLIAELRDNLDLETCFTPLPVLSSTPFTTNLKSNSSEQYVVLDTIRSSLVAKKEVADSWMKAIEAVSIEDDHKVIDLYVLFVLYSVCSRRRAVRNLLMAKVKSGLFTSRLITEMFNCRIPALNDVFPSVLSLCEHLLSSTASSFAQSLYTNAFATVDIFCRQEIVASLVTHTGSGIEKEVNHALDILTILLDSHLTAMTRFAVIIKGVFDNLELLTVSQIRQLYSILSILAHGYGNEELETGIQDELHVIIRKQLFHEEQKYRHMGVIGAVMIIKQISCSSSPSSQHNTTMAQLHNAAQRQPLSENRKQQAISMIEQVTESCKTHHDAAALFFDEMAAVVQKGGMDSAVLHYLAEQITAKFQDIYLIESTDQLPTDLRLPLEYQGGLDSQEDGSIALNLLPILINEEDKRISCEGSLQSMCAHFHLLWVCEQILNEGSLEGVDALLGCSIVMCRQEKLNKSEFDDLPLKQRQTICNCLLHCVNWERELVSAFAPSGDIEMQCKVLTRLKHITDLQNQLETCLTATPGHFTSFDESKKSGRGRKKSNKSDATTQIDETMKDQTGILDKTTITHTSAPQERAKTYFRELHLSAFQVLGYSPLSSSQLDNSALTGDITTELHPPQLLLLLQELASKTSTCFSRFTKRGQGDGSSDTADHLANVLVTDLLPSLCNHLENTSVFFQAQLVEQEVIDAQQEESEVRSRCLQTILKILTTLFLWTPLSDSNHSALLLSAIKSIACRLSQSESQLDTTSSSKLAGLAMQYLGKFSEFLPSLPSAYLLIKLLVAVCKVVKSDKQLKTAISDRCQKILKSSWTPLPNESNAQRNEALEYIVKYYMDWSPDPLLGVETMCQEVIPELMGEDAELQSEQFQTLTVNTFPCYYRAMLCAVVNVVKTISPPSRNMLPTGAVVTERLQLLEISAKVFFMLINLVKSFDARPVLKAALKYGNKYVEAFLRSGIPVVDSLFRARKDDVTSLLKTVQQSTRCLQHYCTHSKVTKDTILTNLIPSLRRSLETLVFRVKDVLTNHNCLEAFWVGNLKNRDLQGHEILSQYSQQARSSSSSQGDDANERLEQGEEEISDESDED